MPDITPEMIRMMKQEAASSARMLRSAFWLCVLMGGLVALLVVFS